MHPECTLDEFILADRIPSRAWVSFPEWTGLYVRLTMRSIKGTTYTNVLDLSNIAAETPGQGAFGRLLDHIQKTYPYIHVYVENVLEKRFADHIRKLGFLEIGAETRTPSFFRKATGTRPIKKTGNGRNKGTATCSFRYTRDSNYGRTCLTMFPRSLYQWCEACKSRKLDAKEGGYGGEHDRTSTRS